MFRYANSEHAYAFSSQSIYAEYICTIEAFLNSFVQDKYERGIWFFFLCFRFVLSALALRGSDLHAYIPVFVFSKWSQKWLSNHIIVFADQLVLCKRDKRRIWFLIIVLNWTFLKDRNLESLKLTVKVWREIQ